MTMLPETRPGIEVIDELLFSDGRFIGSMIKFAKENRDAMFGVGLGAVCEAYSDFNWAEIRAETRRVTTSDITLLAIDSSDETLLGIGVITPGEVLYGPKNSKTAKLSPLQQKYLGKAAHALAQTVPSAESVARLLQPSKVIGIEHSYKMTYCVDRSAAERSEEVGALLLGDMIDIGMLELPGATAWNLIPEGTNVPGNNAEGVYLRKGFKVSSPPKTYYCAGDLNERRARRLLVTREL